MLCITDLFLMTSFAHRRNDTPETSSCQKDATGPLYSVQHILSSC
jgi:hypothetical protein